VFDTVQISAWLGTNITDTFELSNLLRAGLPISVINVFMQQGLTAEEFHELVIPKRTLRHRKTRQEHLTVDESGKAYRAARVLAAAEEVFGDRQLALAWLRSPKMRFQGHSPLAMLRDEAGARLVEEMLNQIDDGIFA
jgi:putative toxin-antitoxin system antitoxin component (TIGR02293 family)